MSQDFNNNSKISRIDKLDALLQLQPNDCFLLHALGLEYLKLGETSKACNYFENVLNTNSRYIGTYYHLAKTLEQLNRIDEAKIIYQKGIVLSKELKDMHAGNELQMALEELDDE